MLKTKYKINPEYSGYFNKNVYRVYRTNENQPTAIALTILLISSLSFLIFIRCKYGLNAYLADVAKIYSVIAGLIFVISFVICLLILERKGLIFWLTWIDTGEYWLTQEDAQKFIEGQKKGKEKKFSNK